MKDIFEELSSWQQSCDGSDSQKKNHKHKDHAPYHTSSKVPDEDRVDNSHED